MAVAAWSTGQPSTAGLLLSRPSGGSRSPSRSCARWPPLGAGVLHKDLKPANILIAERQGPDGASAFRVRLADFGSGALVDGVAPEAYGISGIPIEAPGSDSGTAGYRAPELLAGGVPTVKSDIWAAGLILFQLVAGDFKAALAPGWRERGQSQAIRSGSCWVHGSTRWVALRTRERHWTCC